MEQYQYLTDVCQHNGNIDPVFLKKAITDRTKAIIVVHTYWLPADMDEIMKIVKKIICIKLLKIVLNAHGTLYKGKPVGTFGDIGDLILNLNK